MGGLTVLSRGGLVRLVGDGEVDPDLSAVEVHAADVIDTLLRILDGCHRHKPETSRSIRLQMARREPVSRSVSAFLEAAADDGVFTHSLVIDDDNLDDLTVL